MGCGLTVETTRSWRDRETSLQLRVVLSNKIVPLIGVFTKSKEFLFNVSQKKIHAAF